MMNGHEPMKPAEATDTMTEDIEPEVDKWVRETTLRSPAPPAPPGWQDRIRALLAEGAESENEMTMVVAYDPAVRTLGWEFLSEDGPVNVQELDTLCMETWVTVIRTLWHQDTPRAPLTSVLGVMRTRYSAYARQEMRCFRAPLAPKAIDGAVEEMEVPPHGEDYLDSVRGRLEIDRVRRMVHESLPLAVAIDRLECIRDWAAERRLSSVESEACIEISKALRHQGQLSTARRPALHALRLSTRANDHRLMILANFELSMMSSGLDDDRYITRMVDLGAEDAPGFHARVCYSRARSAWKVGKLLEAVDLLRLCLELYAQVGDRYGYARAEVRFGSYLRRAGVFGQAEAHLGNALSMARAEGYRRVEGFALLRLGILRRVVKFEREAESMMTEALGIFRELGDIPGEAQALGSLARLYRQERRFDEAMDYAQRCLTVCDRLDETGFPRKRISMATAVAYRRLWKCYRDAGQLPAVVTVLDSGMERYKDTGDKFGRALTMALMAEVLVVQGELEDAEELAKGVETLLAQPAGALYSGSTEEDMDENPRTLFELTITCLAQLSEGILETRTFLSPDQEAEVRRSQSALHENRRLVHETLQGSAVPDDMPRRRMNVLR